MKIIYKLSLFIFIIAYSEVLFASEETNFHAYFIKHNKELKLERIDYTDTPDSKRFKTTLENNIGSPPNFAGSYLITANGCGTMCQINHVVNVKTGVVVNSITSSLGACFSSTSRLLIINPYLSEHFPDDTPEWAYVSYYLLQDNNLTLIRKSKKNYEGKCESGQ